MDADEAISHRRQSTDEIEAEAKRLRFWQIKRGPIIRNRPESYWTKLDPSVFGMSEKLVQRARVLGEAMLEQIKRLDDPIAKMVVEEYEYLSQKTEEAMDPCNSVRFQHVEESKSPSKEYATPNPENAAHLSGLPSQQVQAKLSEGFSCPSNTPVEYCMSDDSSSD